MKLKDLVRLIPNYSLTFRGMARFGDHAKFDCNNCAKKIAEPECKSCHKMVNYFQVFRMYYLH